MGARAEELWVVGDVAVRPWRTDDVDALHALVLANLDHLRPWMPWVAGEPLGIAERRALVEGWSAAWDDGRDRTCAIVDSRSGDVLGGCGLHDRIGPGGLEIGYWVGSDRIGRGVATCAVLALVRMAGAMEGITHVEVHHDRANVASGRVAEKAGFTRTGERPDEVLAPGEVGIEVVWRLDLPGFGVTPPS